MRRLNELLIIATTLCVPQVWSMELRPLAGEVLLTDVFLNLEPAATDERLPQPLLFHGDMLAHLNFPATFESIVLGSSLKNIWEPENSFVDFLTPIQPDYGYSAILSTIRAYLKVAPRSRDINILRDPLPLKIELSYKPNRKKTPVNC